MPATPQWLGPLILLGDYTGDSVAYIDAVYAVFVRDFVTTIPQFKGKKVLFDRATEEGRPRTFNHITTEEDHASKQRVLSLRRCERIGWIKSILENADDPAVLVWEKEQKTSKGRAVRTYLYLEQEKFLVIVEELSHGHYLITAIYVDLPHQHRKHLKAYAAYKKGGTGA